jgi:hypothetical protein
MGRVRGRRASRPRPIKVDGAEFDVGTLESPSGDATDMLSQWCYRPRDRQPFTAFARFATAQSFRNRNVWSVRGRPEKRVAPNRTDEPNKLNPP